MKTPKARIIGSRRSTEGGPLHADELIAREAARANVVPTRPSVKQPPPKRRLIVSTLNKSAAAPTLRPVRDIPGAYIADSSSRLVIGALGRSGAHLPLTAAPKGSASSTPPKRPRNIDYSYLPRIAPRRTQPLLRS